MKDDFHEDPEDCREEPLRFLGRLYDEENQILDADEAEALNPILQTLRQKGPHYSDEEFLCEGGEKRIFKVRDLLTDRIIAMAKPLRTSTDLSRERFLREARLTANLQHPNIISVYEQGLDDEGNPYFTMEYVPGDDLGEIVKKLKPADDARAGSQTRLLEIFIKICDSLAYAHSRGVVHLDVKPANIKVGSFGEALLCDWGLARVITGGFDEIEDVPGDLLDDRPNSDLQNDLDASGLVKGTPGFMAPEQVRREGVLDERTDVYALGAVLYFILTQRPPVDGKSSHEILDKTLCGQIDPPSRVTGRFIPRGLEAVVMKALALEPENRYPSVIELRDELERFSMGFATDAQQAGLLDRLVLLIKRRPVVFRVVAASLCIFTVVTSLAFVRIIQEKQNAVAARHVAENLRRRAEENLRLYKEEVARSRMLSDSIGTALESLQKRDNYLDAVSKIHLLTVQLESEKDPDMQQLFLKQLAMLHFVRQNFSLSVTYFEQVKEPAEYQVFYDLSRRYLQKKPDDRVWLPPAHVRELILAIPMEFNNVAYSLAFYYFGTPPADDPEAMLPLVETLLARLNGLGRPKQRMTTLYLEQHPGGTGLSLAGKPYTEFHLPLPAPRKTVNVLSPLNLYALDFSGGKISSPDPLVGLDVQEVNLTGIDGWSISQLHRLKPRKLKRIYHSFDVDDELLQKISPQTEFIRRSP
ncbi:serine/threonine protein kinase [Pontiella agarivorans]|uniref:Serine/threonine-protein kinase n=1 Tax=Pontiella agarivorans TaxID=3038953 RepID=A0ABU5MY37_9BACT|nr:serine/threonine-protein kinase [Pontiella agarivorans]MDZ8119084.1 serine/threonine-protein kinase [Pontiella agarivorans]